MIEPFSPGAGAGRRRPQDRLLRHLELWLRRALRGRIQDIHEYQFDHRRSEELRREILRGFQGTGLHHSAELLRAGEHGGILSDSAQRFDRLSGEMRHRAIPVWWTPIPAPMCRSPRCVGASGRLAWDGSRLKPAKVSAFVPQGKREIFELRTRAGLRIRATANHPFRMLKRWVPLSELRPGDRIAVAREIPMFGKTPIPDWEASLLGLMISEGQCNTPGHSPTYTTADPAMVALLESAMAASGLGRLLTRVATVIDWSIEGPRRDRATKSRARWLRNLELNVGRRRQVRAAEHLHGARALGSPVSAGAFQRRRQHLSLRSERLPRVLLEVPAADRGCAPSSAAIRNLLADPRKDHGDWNTRMQNTDHG